MMTVTVHRYVYCVASVSKTRKKRSVAASIFGQETKEWLPWQVHAPQITCVPLPFPVNSQLWFHFLTQPFIIEFKVLLLMLAMYVSQ